MTYSDNESPLVFAKDFGAVGFGAATAIAPLPGVGCDAGVTGVSVAGTVAVALHTAFLTVTLNVTPLLLVADPVNAPPDPVLSPEVASPLTETCVLSFTIVNVFSFLAVHSYVVVEVHRLCESGPV
jgi:hypothetical protein